MQVSIIIVNYNTYNLTSRCIESIIEHTQDVSYEIVLVDNASTDVPIKVYSEKYPNIKIIENSKNLGFSKANNIGISNSSGQYIFLLNSDAYLKENSVLKLVSFADSKTKPGAISPKIVFPNGNIQHTAQKFPSILLLLMEFFRLHKFMSYNKRSRLFLGSFFNQDYSMKVDWVWGAAFFFKRSLLKNLNESRLNQDFFMYQEDMKWCKDFSNLGYDNYFMHTSTIIHDMGGSGLKEKNEMSTKHFNDFIIQDKGSLYLYFYKLFYNALRITIIK